MARCASVSVSISFLNHSILQLDVVDRIVRDRDDVYLESASNDSFFWGPLMLTSSSEGADGPGDDAGVGHDKVAAVIDLESEKKVVFPLAALPTLADVMQGWRIEPRGRRKIMDSNFLRPIDVSLPSSSPFCR